MDTVTQGTFTTPRGRTVTMKYRADTSDWNTLSSCMTEDEYHFADLHLVGTALDVGAHIGGATVSLAIDNPDLRVVAVEAVPPNVELLRQNIELNGLSDRVTVVDAAAGRGRTATINWGFTGSETARHHAYIGNSLLPDREKFPHQQAEVRVRTLASLDSEFGPFCFAKVDCEGCEYAFLDGTSVLPLIRGEEHHGPLQLPDYAVSYTQDSAPRGFEAVRRG